MNDELFQLIMERRSIRSFTDQRIREDELNRILDAGSWAPSGKNNQPWRFAVIHNEETQNQIAGCTKYSDIVENAPVLIAVLYHLPSGYHREKDYMSIGACLQNMLLQVHAMGLGAVWLGEILNRASDVMEILNLTDDYELAAVIALGHSDENPTKGRKSLEELVVYNDS
jgi:nitroreductase